LAGKKLSPFEKQPAAKKKKRPGEGRAKKAVKRAREMPDAEPALET
jgi:hypothetical protein